MVTFFIVDQPATIGALPVAVERGESALVAYLPGLAMHHIADLHAVEAKTDARDAAIIADIVRSMPNHTLRSLRLYDDSRQLKLQPSDKNARRLRRSHVLQSR